MRSAMTTIWTIAAICGLTLVVAGQASAQQTDTVGIVRIQDGGPPAAEISSASPQPTAVFSSSASLVSAGPQCSTCGTPPAYCPECGYGKPKDLDEDDEEESLHDKMLHWLHAHGHHSPDHGWGRPVKRPVHRALVMYQKYWPDRWYGTPGSQLAGPGANYYPMVYMPTDTTQLGFYYQQVPFWRPDYRRLPPVPWPGHWHKRECITPGPVQVRPAVASACEYPWHETQIVTEPKPDLQPVPKKDKAQPEEAPPPPNVPEKDLNKSARRIGGLR